MGDGWPKMKIVIPMAGQGQRFIDAGYSELKPLIEVDGKPMIQRVVEMFSREEDEFIFICDSKHLELTNMKEVLSKLVKKSKIVSIDWIKYGPVWGILQALAKENFLKEEEQVIVCYCDFSLWWDYSDFKKKISELNCDGAIVAYRGFHPHSLGNTLYGYCKCDANNYLIEIREKESFTDNPLQEFAAAGMYYFKKGKYVKNYFAVQWDRGIEKNGEFYVSLAYNLMIADGLKTFVYEVEHFLQWGTPEDLAEYNYWSGYFHNYSSIGPY